MNQEFKRTNKVVVVLLAMTPVLLILLPILFIALAGFLFIPKMLGSIEERAGFYNYGIKGLKVYVPSDWDEQGNYRVSPSRNCKIIGGTTLYDQDRVERGLIRDELEHEMTTINDIDMSYGYKDNGTEKIYSYFFEANGYKYFTLFINNVDSDEECDSYIDKFEQSITYEYDDEY